MKKTTKIFGLLLTLFGLALVTGCTPITDTPDVPEETTYTVTIASDIANGTVTADKTSAKAGETVKLTATPDSGYELDTFYVNDNAITGSTFTMPVSNVTVDATFTKTAETLNREAADAVIAKINAIGTVEYTDTSKAKIDDARAAYNALTDAQKALVSAETLAILTTAESTYNTLKAEADNNGNDEGNQDPDPTPEVTDDNEDDTPSEAEPEETPVENPTDETDTDDNNNSGDESSSGEDNLSDEHNDDTTSDSGEDESSPNIDTETLLYWKRKNDGSNDQIDVDHWAVDNPEDYLSGNLNLNDFKNLLLNETLIIVEDESGFWITTRAVLQESNWTGYTEYNNYEFEVVSSIIYIILS